MFQQIIRLDVNNKSNFACSFYYHKKTAIVATQIHMIRRRRCRRCRRRIIRIIYYPRLLKGRCAAHHAKGSLRSPILGRGVAPPTTLGARSARPSSGASPPRAPTPLYFTTSPKLFMLSLPSQIIPLKNKGRRRGAAPPRSPKGAEQLYVFLKKCGTSASREWSIFFKNTRTQTSTPLTNPYDSNSRHARIHRIT